MLNIGVVANALGHGHLAGAPGCDAAGHQLRRVHQQSGAHAVCQALRLQGPHPLAQHGQTLGHGLGNTTLMGDDGGFKVYRRVVESQAHKALAGGRLQVFDHALVARVVREDQRNARVCPQQLAGLFNRQLAPVVGQRMDHHGGVLARLHHLIEVADGAAPHRPGERAIGPHGAVVRQQVAAHQVIGREVFMASHGDQWLRSVGPQRGVALRQAGGHVLDKSGLATTGGAFEQHRQLRGISRLEQRHLVGHRQVPGQGG